MQLTENILFDNRYLLKRLVGRGGFAEVWLVEDKLTGLDEAIKIYVPQSGMDEDGLRVFAKELQVVHDLHHSALLTPKLLSQFEGRPYLVMQYCPNGSLVKRVGQVSEDEAWKILRQVASGIAYLHEHGIVHQDIKPDNILIDAHDDYVITDFGISLKAQTTLRKSQRVAATSGTADYMAPERFSESNSPTASNDIWSLGAMMFELIEGTVPFVAQMGGLAQKNGADIPTIQADVSDELKQTIYGMLSLVPQQRPTAKQLKSAEEKDGDLPPESEDTSTTKSSASILVILGSILLVALLGLTVSWTWINYFNQNQEQECQEPQIKNPNENQTPPIVDTVVCDDTPKQEVKREPTYESLDWKQFDLKGRVKSVHYVVTYTDEYYQNYDYTIHFSKDGLLLSKATYAGCTFKRDNKGRIVKIIHKSSDMVEEWEEGYFYNSEGLLQREEFGGWEYGYFYTYNYVDGIRSYGRTNRSGGGYDDVDAVNTYVYSSRDEYGNWTKGRVTYSGQYTELGEDYANKLDCVENIKRVITYY